MSATTAGAARRPKIQLSRGDKIGLVIGGYGLTLVGAGAAAFVNFLFTQGPAAQASAGMAAFGDALLFFGAFGLLALLPTLLGFFFLRPYKTLWTWFAVACLLVALTGPLATIVNTVINASRAHDTDTGLLFSLIGILHTFAVPLLFVTFAALAVIAPGGRPRWLMLASAGTEILTGLYALTAFVFFGRVF